MITERKLKARKQRKGKATAPATASGSQRSLRDMFPGPSKPTEVAEAAVTHEPAVVSSGVDACPEETAMSPAQDTNDMISLPDTTSVCSTDDSICAPAPSDHAFVSDGRPETIVPENTLPKRLHPFFERSKRQQDNQSVLRESDRDIIHISDEDSCAEEPTPYARELGERVLSQFPNDRHTSPVPACRQGSSRDMPIVVEASPIRSRNVRSTSKSVFPMFASKQRGIDHAMAGSLGQITAPYPDRIAQHVRGPQTEPRDIPWAQSSRRHTEEAYAGDYLADQTPLSQICCEGSTPSTHPSVLYSQAVEMQAYIDTIPLSDQTIPSISRLLRLAQSNTENESDLNRKSERWADRWRPRRAEEVIGNEQHAIYLRDWLVALRVQGDVAETPSSSQTSTASKGKKRKPARKKRPQVVRHVKKRRGALEELMTDFVAPDDISSDEDTLAAPSSDFDDFAFCQAMNARMNGDFKEMSRASSPSVLEDEPPESLFTQRRRLGMRLRNTILISGPSGSGKTAAVYACAEELGWEVFEVYPGIGERNGASLYKLVGDVGRNHLVTAGRQGTPDTASPKPNIFQKPRIARRPIRALQRIQDSSDVESVPDEVDHTEATTLFQAPIAGDSTPAAVRQSLVLVEEVDILYQTDSNFWPALINIIKDCRRPVVLTCNDISLVPCLDLPLQDTLLFQPCPPQRAASYLQALCLAEGRQYPRRDLAHLYDTSSDLSCLSHDLRHTINLLQILPSRIPLASPSSPTSTTGRICPQNANSHCADMSPLSSPSESVIPGSSLPPLELPESQLSDAVGSAVWEEMSRMQDVHSFTDAYSSRAASASLWNLFQVGPTPSLDDEIGYSVLYSERDVWNIPVSSFFRQDEVLLEEVLRRTHAAARASNASDEESCLDRRAASLDKDRRVYLNTAGRTLRTFSSAHVSGSDPALHLDYAPWVRHIIRAEDDMDAAVSLAQPVGQGRMTRNSQRTETMRWLRLSEDERRILATTRLTVHAMS